MQSAEWFHDHDVAAVATDTLTFEVFPCEREDLMLPVHPLHLVDMGLWQGQNWNLEELAADCADDGRYAFPVGHARTGHLRDGRTGRARRGQVTAR